MNDSTFFLKALEVYSEHASVKATDLIACLDLTALNTHETEADIHTLCSLARKHRVAAVCVFPQALAFVQQALESRPATYQIATVANFPSGAEPLLQVLASIDTSLALGASEIDVVIPYQRFLIDKDTVAIRAFVHACKTLCGTTVKLKTIVESGLIDDSALLERLCLAVLEGGADFIKTSTGKVTPGATLEASMVLLGALKAFGEPSRGFKAAGGVKTALQAKKFWLLAQLIMGDAWPSPHCFRIGASTLLNDLLISGDVTGL